MWKRRAPPPSYWRASETSAGENETHITQAPRNSPCATNSTPGKRATERILYMDGLVAGAPQEQESRATLELYAPASSFPAGTGISLRSTDTSPPEHRLPLPQAAHRPRSARPVRHRRCGHQARGGEGGEAVAISNSNSARHHVSDTQKFLLRTSHIMEPSSSLTHPLRIGRAGEGSSGNSFGQPIPLQATGRGRPAHCCAHFTFWAPGIPGIPPGPPSSSRTLR